MIEPFRIAIPPTRSTICGIVCRHLTYILMAHAIKDSPAIVDREKSLRAGYRPDRWVVAPRGLEFAQNNCPGSDAWRYMADPSAHVPVSRPVRGHRAAAAEGIPDDRRLEQ